MTLQDPHFIPKAPGRWSGLAEHLRQHPQDFQIALDNLDRWEQWGRAHPAPLREWRRRIVAALANPAVMDAFLAWLAQDNEDSEPLKSCSPFVGILPAASLS